MWPPKRKTQTFAQNIIFLPFLTLKNKYFLCLWLFTPRTRTHTHNHNSRNFLFFSFLVPTIFSHKFALNHKTCYCRWYCVRSQTLAHKIRREMEFISAFAIRSRNDDRNQIQNNQNNDCHSQYARSRRKKNCL